MPPRVGHASRQGWHGLSWESALPQRENQLVTFIDEIVTLAGKEWVIIRPPSAEELIDESAYARDERLPYWAELWPSAIVLAERISEIELDGRRVLELGCGLGLPSLVAARAGADVIATDWYREALDFAKRNARTADVKVAVALLDWFSPAGKAVEGAPYDLVIGADLLYEDRNGRALGELLPRLVAPGGRVLISDPRRPNARALWDALEPAGWSRVTTDVEYDGRPDESGRTIHLHDLAPPT